MRTVTVTIGRNVGTSPLSPESWNEFVSQTREAVKVATDELWAVAPYRGSWDGVSEDSAVFYGPLKDGDQDWYLRALRTQLANLATYYRQEAIGLSVGVSELVESWQAETTEVAA